MKKNWLILIILIGLSGVGGCKKHHTQPKVPAPTWTVDETGKYPASMTAVLQVPNDLKPYTQTADKMGAFVGDECRGLGQLVQVGDQKVFFLLIHGTTSEQSQLSFRYWSAWRSAMYETDPVVGFEADGNFGTADGPEVLDLRPAKE